jgi:polyphosphate glucokinase
VCSSDLGVSKEHEMFLPLLKLKTKIVPATNRNSAGILGAAYWAKKHTID